MRVFIMNGLLCADVLLRNCSLTHCSSREPSELSQWPFCGDSTINIVLVIIIIMYVLFRLVRILLKSLWYMITCYQLRCSWLRQLC